MSKVFQAKLVTAIKTFDVTILCWFMAHRYSSVLSPTGRVVSRTGDGYYYVLIALALYLSDYPVPDGFFAGLLLAFVFERALYYLLKLGFKRDRPASSIAGFNSLIKPADKFSFPSGHTSAAFLFACYMGVLMPALTPWLLIWAAMVGLSRFCLGVHFLTDILMGALLGSSIAYTSISFMTL